MSLEQSKVGNIFLGDQIAFRQTKGNMLGTVMGFGYADVNGKLQPYLKTAEFPDHKILVPQVEKIINRGKRQFRDDE